MNPEHDPSIPSPEEEKMAVQKGDIVLGSGTVMTKDGVECEVLKVYPNGAAEVRIREGKFVGEKIKLSSIEMESTGRTTKEEDDEYDRRMAEHDEKTRREHEGAKVGDEIIARNTAVTRDGIRARITKMSGSPGERIEAELLEGPHKGETFDFLDSEWALRKE